MSGQDLASFASGITGSFFGGLLEDRQNEQKRKDEELVRQLAAYHALLEHPDTPESEIPNILDAQARLLKAGKDFAPITAHMREAMKRQVPYGPEHETAGSINDRVSANESAIPEAAVELPGSVPMRPMFGVPSSVYNADDTASFSVTRPAVLPTVPPEPDMYQPTREYGSLSQGEATDIRKGNLYADQQTEMMRRQLQVQGEADEARAKRERDHAEAARKAEELKQQGRIAVVKATYDEKAKLLGPAAMAKIEQPRLAYKHSLMVGPNAMSDADAEIASYNLFRTQMDTELAEKKQKIEESKKRMERMGVQNAESWERIRKSKTSVGLLGGMSTNAQREFGLRTGTLQSEMSSVLRQLEVLYKKRDDEGPDPTRQASIDALEQQKADLWTNIDAVRNDLLNRSVPSVPGMPGASRTPARQGKDPLGLFAQ